MIISASTLNYKKKKLIKSIANRRIVTIYVRTEINEIGIREMINNVNATKTISLKIPEKQK